MFREYVVGSLDLTVGSEILVIYKNGVKEGHVPYRFTKQWREAQGDLHIKGKEVIDWVESRVVQKNSVGVLGVLNSLGMYKYDPVKMFIGAKGQYQFDGWFIV